MAYKVLLYYKFVSIKNPDDFVEEQRKFCEKHKLLGRIIIAKEGINGTCAGKKKDIEAYKKFMHKKKEFKDLWFKEQDADHQPFPKLQVRHRPEIVTFRVDNLNMKKTGKHISPKDLHKLIEKEDVVFMDMRNRIESRIGKFKNAITPNMKTFRDLPNLLPQYNHLKNKNIVMYCTGGIRCEKASAYMAQNGFKKVHQIDGGIYNYCSQYPDGLFEGTCFVFDDRMQIGFGKGKAVLLENQVPHNKIISACDFCSAKTCRVVNDERVKERKLMICCEDCDKKFDISRIRSEKERANDLLRKIKYIISNIRIHISKKREKNQL